MGCGSLFHLDLHFTIARIHVVELLHARCTRISLLFGIELLVDVENLPMTAQEESEGIEAGMLIVALASLCRKLMEQ